MKIEMRPTNAIRPYARNPRDNDEAVAPVAASIREFGFRQPIVVDADGVVRLWTPDGRPIASHRPGAAVATLAAWGEDAVAVLLRNGKLVRIRLVEVVQEK